MEIGFLHLSSRAGSMAPISPLTSLAATRLQGSGQGTRVALKTIGRSTFGSVESNAEAEAEGNGIRVERNAEA